MCLLLLFGALIVLGSLTPDDDMLLHLQKLYGVSPSAAERVPLLSRLKIPSTLAPLNKNPSGIFSNEVAYLTG